MAKNISNKIYREGLKDIIDSIKKYDPEKIILFGSAVNGKLNKNSDVDLLVIKDTDESFWPRQLRVTNLYKGWIPTDIFVVTPNELNQAITENRFFVTEEILKKGKVVYEKISHSTIS